MALTASACVFRTVEVERIEPQAGYDIRTPIKAHLRDGHTLVFLGGARVDRDTLRGNAERYDLTARFVDRIETVPLDSVIGLESFRTGTKTAETVLGTTVAVAGTAAAVGLAAVAIFGSCPTVYSDSAGTARLESETFSYSIAPIFEGRDVDRLRALPDRKGRLRLDVRNEALETHYLNHLSLLEVAHAEDAIAAPDPAGAPLVFREPIPVARIVDRIGRDLGVTLAREDGIAFRSDSLAVEAALGRSNPSSERLRDAIEFELSVPPGAAEVGLVLTLRNSLFSTVLFYDVMLRSQGARALEWLGRDLAEIDQATELGLWVVQNLGLRVEVWDGTWQPVGRIADTGPIAWGDVGFVVPTGMRDSLKVRLSFPFDSWRIDRVATFADVARSPVRSHDLARALDATGATLGSALASLVDVDERYVVTGPGQRFFVEFDTGGPGEGEMRTYFLVSHGYYTEWVRPAWIGRSPAAPGFTPGNGTLLQALQSWWSQRNEMESRFFESRVPIASGAEAVR